MSSNGTEIKLRKPIIYFDNVDIESVAEAKSVETKANTELDKLKGDLLSLAMATPKDITPKGEKPVDYIKEEVDNLMEELYEAFSTYFEANFVNGILDEWSYSYPNDSKDIYDNCTTDDEINKQAFPKDKHVEIKHDLNKFTFAPDDATIDYAINRSYQNVMFNNGLLNIYNKYVIILGNVLFVDYDGQFLFRSLDAAIEVLDKKFDLHTIDYISKDFIENHPHFFPSIIEKMEKTNYYDLPQEDWDKEINKFKDAFNNFVNNDYAMEIDTMEVLHHGIVMVLRNEICNKADIHIKSVFELVSGFKKSEEYKDIITEAQRKKFEESIVDVGTILNQINKRPQVEIES